MKHEANLSLDLTNEKEAALYNTIRSLDGIKNAIAGFKNYLNNRIKEIEFSKDEAESTTRKFFLPTIKEIIDEFENSFRKNGITV